MSNQWTNAYQERRNWSKPQHVVAAEISITKESSNQSTKVASAIEDVDDIGGSDGLHVENRSQINQEIGWGSNGSKLLKSFISCIQNSSRG